MAATVKEITELFSSWALPELAETWDNCGFQLGNPASSVKRVVVALDISWKLLEFARETGAQMVITHHPAIFHPIKTLDTSKPNTRLLAGFLCANIAVASFHTSLDSAPGGVNDCLAQLLNLKVEGPLLPGLSSVPGSGMGRIGSLPAPMSGQDFLDLVGRRLGCAALSYAGPVERECSRIAVCGGSGSSLLESAFLLSADALVTAEVKHSVAMEAEELGLLVVDAGHFTTEYPVVEKMAEFLMEKGQELQLGVEVEIFSKERAPLHYISF